MLKRTFGITTLVEKETIQGNDVRTRFVSALIYLGWEVPSVATPKRYCKNTIDALLVVMIFFISLFKCHDNMNK